jgi:cyclophilin family peptidyl-prolyl cis-trans isomerase
MAMKRIVCFVLAGIVGIGTKASAQAPAQSAAKPQSGAAAKPRTQAKGGSTAVRSPYDRALLRPALLKDKAPGSYQVKFTTTRGEFVVTVTRAWAPLGADRFYNLVKHHYYDNSSFFRVVPDFVVQFGLSAYPPVSAAWKDTNIKDDPVTQSNKKGSITFATAGPNTRTTQVFISLKDNTRLDSMGFAPFGVVEGKGMDVVEMMYGQYGDNAGPDQDQIQKQGKPYLDKGWPKLDSIKSATLVAPAGAVAAAKPAAAPAPTKP